MFEIFRRLAFVNRRSSDFEPRRCMKDEAEVVRARALEDIFDEEAARRAFKHGDAAVRDRARDESRVTVMLGGDEFASAARLKVDEARACFVADLKRHALVRRALLDVVHFDGRMISGRAKLVPRVKT